MKFSVIIPAYNSEEFISRAVNSVLDQTYKNYELIIINDGSTDNTSKICHQFAHINKNIQVIDKKNEGLSAARNTGIKKASGEYLVFLDSDDKLHSSDTLQKIIPYCNGKPDMIIGNVIGVRNKKSLLISDNSKLDIEKNDNIKEIVSKYILDNQQPPWLAFQNIINRDFLKKEGVLFNESTSTQEDLLFFFQLIQVVKSVKLIDEVLVDYTLSRKGAITTVISFSNVYNALINFATVYDHYSFNEVVKKYIAGRFADYVPPVAGFSKEKKRKLYRFIETKKYILKDARSDILKYRMYKTIWNIFGLKKGNKILAIIKSWYNVFNS